MPKPHTQTAESVTTVDPVGDALRFVDQRRVEPLVRRLLKDTPIFAHLSLAPHEVKQLGYLFRHNSSRALPPDVDETLTDALVVRSTYRFFEERGDDIIVDALLSVPIEWWNVVDVHGQVPYQVWLYGAGDCGFVFRGGTANPVGGFEQGTWFTAFDGPVVRFPDSCAAPPGLARQLSAALAIYGEDRGAIQRWLRSELGRAQFK
jgi:hypothetical protein